MKHGLLLINVGTPAAADVFAVKRYLRAFLSDKRVIALPALLRYLFVRGVILPLRSKKSAKAYQAIWTEAGSPLLVNSRLLQTELQKKLGENWMVELGMRYETPSITTALKALGNCQSLTILPLYPQYSTAATGSALEYCLQELSTQTHFPTLKIINAFYDNPAFIEAQAALIKPELEKHDFLLFSYHGIPERQLAGKSCPKICQEPCPPLREDIHYCYRAQCFATSHLLAKALQLTENQFSTAFQSRLGKASWIKPYTNKVLTELAAKGIKRLAIVCPSFVVDCLETLEEIGLRARQQWLALGGETLTLIPCVNASKGWVQGMVELINL